VMYCCVVSWHLSNSSTMNLMCCASVRTCTDTQTHRHRMLVMSNSQTRKWLLLPDAELD
jgi:hypothetical protein